MAVVSRATSANLAFMVHARIAEHIYRCSGLKIQSLNVIKTKLNFYENNREYNATLYATYARHRLMEYTYSKLSTRTTAMAMAVTCLALLVTTTVSAATVNPADKGYDNLGMLTFFTFFVGYIAMGAAFVFFLVERNNVAPQFRTTMTISALIVGIAAMHYYYMRGVYIDHDVVSIEYRYMDWIITVPLMALKFPSLVGKDAITEDKFLGMGFTAICFVGALIMIGFGYAGEAGLMDGMIALILGGMGWAMIIVATGTPWTSGKGVDNSKIAPELMWSTNALRWFIVVGWIIYPLGYLFNPTVDMLDNVSVEQMAVLYNIADMINKIGFGVVAWMGAKKATEMMA